MSNTAVIILLQCFKRYVGDRKGIWRVKNPASTIPKGSLRDV